MIGILNILQTEIVIVGRYKFFTLTPLQTNLDFPIYQLCMNEDCKKLDSFG